MPNMGFRGIYAAANSALGGRITAGDLIPSLRGGFFPFYTIGNDPYFNYTTLLLKATGANTAQNYTVLDSSSGNLSITRNGDTTQGAFSPFTGGDGYWSNYFDGTGDYLSFTPNTTFAFGTNDFTVECWYYPTSAVSSEYLIDNRNASQLAVWVFTYNWTGSNSGTLYWYNGSSALAQSSGSTITNAWNHIVYVRSGTTGSMYINGTRVATQTDSTNYSNTPLSSSIGNRYTNTGGDQYIKGYLSNFRVVKGTAVYDPTQTSITVPTTPLTAISGTSLLTCQSNRFKDNSTNAFTLTSYGDTRVSQFTPIPSAAYETATNGGSFYLDGSGDYLQTSLSLNPSNDFTVEGWFYWTGIRTAPHFFQFALNQTSRWNVYRNSSGNFETFNFGGASSTQVPKNQWFHLAVCKSGSTTRTFFNGTQISSTTSVPGYTTSDVVVGFQNWNGVLNDTLDGYVSNFRVVSGTGLYTTAFTPSTTPVGLVSGTTLLLNATNAGIIDASKKTNVYTVGNAQVRTNVFKYDKSMYFDGSGDYVTVLANPLFNFTGDFTIEFWQNYVLNSNTQTIFDLNYGTAPNVTFQPTNGTMVVYLNGTTITLSGGSADSNGVWYHYALTRSGTTVRLFRNGIIVATTTYTGTIGNSSANIYIGGSPNGGGGYNYYGYLEDVRITSGYARYTANFAAPSGTLLSQ